jgi:hypothetical protein
VEEGVVVITLLEELVDQVEVELVVFILLDLVVVLLQQLVRLIQAVEAVRQDTLNII